LREREDNQIKVLLVDDHALFREGVVEIFAAEDDMRVVGRPKTARRPSRLPKERSWTWHSSTWRCP